MNTAIYIRYFLSSTYYAIIVTMLWVLLYQFNQFVFSDLAYSPYITLIFLPAGLRLIAILLFDSAAVVGLFVGALITNAINQTFDLPTAIVISLISAVSAYISIILTKYIFNINDILHNLNARQLVILALISSTFNSVSHNIFFYYQFCLTSNILNSLLNMFVGDFLGCLIILYLLSC